MNHQKQRLVSFTSLYRSLLLITLLVSMVVAVACTRQDETISDDVSSQLSIEILDPEPGTDSLSVRLADRDGQPLTDAQVSLEGNMNHAGMVPVLTDPVSDGDDGTVDGDYQVPFEPTMFGDWIITVTVDLDGELVTRDFNLSVDAEGIKLAGP